MYSFGINLWELFTRKIPFEGLQPMQVGMAVLTRGVRPEIPADCPKEYAALMRACWDSDATKRPSFGDVITKLQNMIESIP